MKMEFIRSLRALGVAAVTFSHWGHMFFLNPAVCQGLGLFTNVYGGGTPLLITYTSWPPFNFGPFGVAIFFLISGFLISDSLRGRTSGQFAVKRFFRLYPLYFAGLSFTVAVLYASARINGVVFPYAIKDFLANWSLLRLWFWSPSIDGVNWTMEVDVFFYLTVIFLRYFTFDLEKERTMVCLTALGCLLAYLTHGLWTDLSAKYFYVYKFFYCLCHFTNYYAIFFIGTVLYQYSAGRRTKYETFRLVVTLYGIFCLHCHYFQPGIAKSLAVSYGLAIVIFLIFYALRDFIQVRPNKIIAWAADISFPFYLIHAAAGYALLAYLYRLGLGGFSFVFALAVMTLTAFVLHKLIEQPMEGLAKKIVSRMEVNQ